MSAENLKIPILFIIFNRPDTTRRVFDMIKKVKPEKLYLAADGPRDRIGEEKLCQKTRKITERINWNCKVKRLFSKKNLGSSFGPFCAMDWFFKNEEKGIILEDDCLPDISFFEFCQDLLEKYKNDKRIMMISGDNFQDGKVFGDGSYYFSKIPSTWGWATWRRAWKYYDYNLSSYPNFRKMNLIKTVFKKWIIQNYWLKVFDDLLKDGDNWDYKWSYTLFHQNGLCIIPNKNLVSNIGFGSNATHTTNKESKFFNMKLNRIDKIVHPKFILPSEQADLYIMKNHHYCSFLSLLLNKIKG